MKKQVSPFQTSTPFRELLASVPVGALPGEDPLSTPFRELRMLDVLNFFKKLEEEIFLLPLGSYSPLF